MRFDIIRFIETTHPLKFIFVGLFIISIILNITQHKSNRKLYIELQKKPQTRLWILPQPKKGDIELNNKKIDSLII